jgi:class 3 adenylate cyclase
MREGGRAGRGAAAQRGAGLLQDSLLGYHDRVRLRIAQHRPMWLGYTILTALLGGMWLTVALAKTDLWLLDRELGWLRAWRITPVTREVVLVGIDAQTLQAFPEPLAMWHRHFAELLGAFGALRVAAVGLDVVLPDRSYDSLAPGSDRELIRAVAEARVSYPLVLGLSVDGTRRPRPLLPAIEAIAGPGGAGLVLWPVDADHHVRRFDERLAADGGPVPTLVGQLARLLGRQPGHGIIDYSVGVPLDYVPLHTLLAAWRSGSIATFRQSFAGRVVLVGPLFEFEDRKLQPMNLAQWEPEQSDAPGLLLHAQALRSILGPGLIHEAPAAASLALALACALVWFVPFKPLRALAIPIAGTAALLALALVLLDHRLHLALALPIFALAAGSGGRAAHQAMLTLGERRRLRAALAGYVSPQVSAEVLAGKLEGGFEGRRYRVCIMFVDMRDFTPRSERTAPEEMIKLINACFEEMVAAVHGAEGTVMQFMGDGMLALFGAPNKLGNPSHAALLATRELFVRMDVLNRELSARDIEPVRIGVGLNAGDGIVGHVGARARYGYSAVGDVVNVASRLEGLTKETGFPVVCSGSVAADCATAFDLVPLGEKAIKGHSPVVVFGWMPDPGCSNFEG